MLENIGLELVGILAPILASAIVAAISYLIVFLKKKVAKIDNELARDLLDVALKEANRAATEAIFSTQKTLVDDLKAAAEDGKLTTQEKKAAMNKAKDTFIKDISNESLEVLKTSLGPVENWLDNLLESKLKEHQSYGMLDIKKE